jgi:hypothetical protein
MPISCSSWGVSVGWVKAGRQTGVLRIRTEQSTGSPEISGNLWELISRKKLRTR